jgi:hypothetical protein
MAHVQTIPIPLSQRSELSIPAGLEAIVTQLLEKDPAHRIQTAQELARRLRFRDVPAWCPDRAAQWRETNLPEPPVRPPVGDTMPTAELTAASRTVTYAHA